MSAPDSEVHPNAFTAPHTDSKSQGPTRSQSPDSVLPVPGFSSQQTAHQVSLTEATHGVPQTGEAVLHPRGKEGAPAADLGGSAIGSLLSEGGGRCPADLGQQVHPLNCRAAKPTKRPAGPRTQLRRGLGKVRPKTSSEIAVASQRAGLSGDPGVGVQWAAASRRRPEPPSPEAAARALEGRAGRTLRMARPPRRLCAARGRQQPSGPVDQRSPPFSSPRGARPPVLPRTRLPF